MRQVNNSCKRLSRNGQIVLGAVLVVSLIVIGFVMWWVNDNTRVIEYEVEGSETEYVQKENDSIEQINSSVVTPIKQELFDDSELQAVVERWESEQSGTASVVLMSVDGNELASVGKDRSFFAASIYKIYVAYAGYLRQDLGENNKTDIFVNGHTREECLDLMIRESDSPCAEKLWIEIGKAELTNQLKDYGIYNTSMETLSTTAYDSALMLSMIARGEGLSAESQGSYLESMKNQIFRDALNVGFSSNVVVYNKIGFNELVEYHDTAIVKFPDGRQLIVAVLSESVGTRNIASLGKAIETAVNK